MRTRARGNGPGGAPEVMDIYGAAEYLRVSRGTLYKCVRAGDVPAFKLGREWRFRKALLDRWMDEQSEKTKARAPKANRAIGAGNGQQTPEGTRPCQQPNNRAERC